ncbi:MAG: MBL fold metallo-hydrolase [Rhodoferax sp.]|nr:MBL fold metallo-hydrolase [Rhodoferax sp.]MDP3655212.1 MBL fold metallo-hydrolase [Rhodoferax sp.]
MKFRFIGATGGHVTGSCTLFYYPRKDSQFLVDCGLVQGEGNDIEQNSSQFPFDPSEIDFVLLTHAHQDHCGLIPKLYKDGFTGRVICTRATARLAQLSLLDSTHHKDCPFSEDDVHRIRYDHIDDRPDFSLSKLLPIADDLFASFTRSAHILGAMSITIGWLNPSDEKEYLVMSGDLGNNTKQNPYQPLLAGRQGIFGYPKAIIVESTYGGKDRDSECADYDGRIECLRKIIQEEVFDKKSLLLIPAFSLQRTQELLFDLHITFQKFFSTAELSQAPSYFPSDFNDEFENDAWGHGVHQCLLRAIGTLPEIDQDKWRNCFIAANSAGRENYCLVDNPEVSIEDIKNLMSECRHTYPVEIVLDSPLARKMSAVFRDELCRRQHFNPDETVYRNRYLAERFGLGSEVEVDALIKKLFPADNGEEVTIPSGMHEIRYKTGYKTPKPHVLQEKGHILITGGGMCNGGPVLEHFKKTLTAKRRTVLLTNGYMATGSLGGAIQAICQAKHDGTPLPVEPLVIGEDQFNPVDVTLKIIQLQGYYSGHADQSGLMDFIFKVKSSEKMPLDPKPATVFINHGRHAIRTAFRKAIEARASNSLQGDRAINGVETPDDPMGWYDLDAGKWLEPVIETRTDSLLLELIKEQRKTNHLLQRLMDQRSIVESVREFSNKPNQRR